MPSSTYACGGCSEKQTTKKEISSKTDKDNCCDADNHSNSKKSDNCCDSDHSKSKNHDGCGGKCGHSKCVCPSVITGFTISSEFTFKNNVFDFSNEKQKFFNTETSLSSGFYFLWLIPKIS
jgi:hypothetical protein